MPDHPQKPLRIDIVSDVMCPWCVIGYHQLARALDQAQVAHEIHWHPFELNPDMGPDGQNLRDHLTEKYGLTVAQSEENRARITELGAALGFDFRFSDDMRMHNTFNAHQLLHWAEQSGKKHELKQALFAAHFTDRRNLSDPEVLAEVAAEVGLNRREAEQVLADQRFASDVRAAQNFWLGHGIRGVPAMIFDRQHLVTGAQGVENYARILAELTGTRLETEAG